VCEGSGVVVRVFRRVSMCCTSGVVVHCVALFVICDAKLRSVRLVSVRGA
jgi:hypothetical protein